MSSIIVDKTETIIKPIINDLGYDLVDLEYDKKQNGMNLTVFIDSKNGILISDCEIVHKAIDVVLDELDPTDGRSYTLNVSSPGLDRPIKTDKGLSNNIGQMLEVCLYAKMNGKKFFVGELLSFDENSIILKAEEEDIKIEKKSISNIIKYISFL